MLENIPIMCSVIRKLLCNFFGLKILDIDTYVRIVYALASSFNIQNYLIT